MMDQTLPQSPHLPSNVTLRIAVVSTPRTGNTWLRHMLTTLYHVPGMAVHSPGEVDWSSLPPGVVLQLHWPATAEFTDLLARHQFHALTLARHPLDVLISILHFTIYDASTACWLQGDQGNEDGIFAAMPCSTAFLDYATGPRAAALLAVSRLWWEQPNCQRLRYEGLVQDPHHSLKELVDKLGLPVHTSIEEAIAANTFSKLRVFTKDEHHFWRGHPELWKTVLPGEPASAIAARHRDTFATLGYECAPSPLLTVEQADANWIQLARQELAERLQHAKLRERSICDLQAEQETVQQALAVEQKARLATVTELAAEREKLLDALTSMAAQTQKLAEAGAQLEATEGKLELTERQLEATKRLLARLEPVHPLALKMARAVRRLSARFPRASAALKRILRAAQPRPQLPDP